jgi:hypothetical protein
MTVTPIDGMPDLADHTPHRDVTVQIPLDAWKAATSWITGSKPGGKDHPMDQLHMKFTRHPWHYTEGWEREAVTGASLTLQTTDKYRMSWATISDLGDPEDDNRLRYLHGEGQPGAVSVDATVALRAMKGWPTIEKEEIPVHAVQVHWDCEDRVVTLALTNTETSTDLAQSFLPLFDGLHDFPRFTPYAADDYLPVPEGEFAIWPGMLKALMAAAVAACSDRVVRIRTHPQRPILISATPITTVSTLVHTTAAVIPTRVDSADGTSTGADDQAPAEMQEEVWPDA